jgi:catechol 2,3-dioxygenase-like lactoylglutathione lyase family enzyme
MTFRAIDHIGFTVARLDRSIPFYSALLDEEPMLRKTWDIEYIGRMLGYRDVVLDAAFWRLPGEAVLELIEYKRPRGRRVDMETFNVGNAHLCLVTPDLAAEYRRLAALGTEFRSPAPVHIPWGPYKGGRACYLRDPDGVSIELIQLPEGGPGFE